MTRLATIAREDLDEWRTLPATQALQADLGEERRALVERLITGAAGSMPLDELRALGAGARRVEAVLDRLKTKGADDNDDS